MIRFKLLAILFIFFGGSITGWIIELFYRRFISSANPERKWINPGFLSGPYLPIYGFGITFLFMISYYTEKLQLSGPLFIVFIFIMSAIFMTLLELVGGLFFLKYANMRLWDYSDEKGNYKGVICPKFSLIWGLSSLFYYFFINPLCIRGLEYLFNNLDISFYVGLFTGFFLVDFWMTASITPKLREVSKEAQAIFQYDNFKHHIAERRKAFDNRKHFFIKPHLQSIDPVLKEYLRRLKENGSATKR